MLTDQEALATEQVRRQLSERRGSKVTVMNVSAGSWGPGNWRVYAERFGFFNAKRGYLVISGHDMWDAPTYEPLNPRTHPTRRPLLACWELVDRYVLPKIFKEKGEKVEADEEKEGALTRCRSDLTQFIERACGQTKFCILYHPERKELQDKKPHKGKEIIRAIAEHYRVRFIDLSSYYLEAGGDVYRDNIHPNEKGQLSIAEALLQDVEVE